MKNFATRPGGWLTALIFALLLTLSAGVSAATVRGDVSTSSASVGEDVVYELKFEGGSPDKFPAFPKIEGLDVDFAGQSSQTSIVNGNVRHISGYRYRLTPQRAGEIVIPPIEVIVDGQKLATQATTLKISQPEKTAAAGDFAFGELRLGRKPAYAGENLEVELIYYLDATSRWALGPAPVLSGEGYTASKLLRGDEQKVELAGKEYARLIFRGAITPNRAGNLTVGPVTLRTEYSKRLGARRDLFGDVMQSARQLSITAPALELEVKPLPIEGRPKEFSGGIGNFRLSAEGSPDRITIGQPLAMVLKVAGRGNFDRISAPVMSKPEGWRSYPPKDGFEPNDQRGVSGTKSFQIIVTPERKHTAMPVFEFSYFDPEKAKYVTLTSPSIPLTVEGEVPPAPAVPAPVAPNIPAVKPTPPAQDIVGIRPLPGFWGNIWTPAPALWFGMIVGPAPVLAALLYWRARRSDPQAARRAALLREKSTLMERLRSTNDRAELFDVAARVMQLELALATGQPVGAIDEAALLARTDDAAVKRVFAARTELVYAGGESAKATAGDRDEAMEAVEKMVKAVR